MVFGIAQCVVVGHSSEEASTTALTLAQPCLSTLPEPHVVDSSSSLNLVVFKENNDSLVNAELPIMLDETAKANDPSAVENVPHDTNMPVNAPINTDTDVVSMLVQDIRRLVDLQLQSQKEIAALKDMISQKEH